MPELPEVETVVRDLRAVLVGHRILHLEYWNWERTFGGLHPEEWGRRLAGLRVQDVVRRAKRILVVLETDEYLVISLRMTGQLVYFPPEHPPETDKSTRFLLSLDNGYLRFADARKFGRAQLLSREEWITESAHLGPEPLALNLVDFRTLLGTRKGMLKPALLDQRFLSGVGNIYADEALWLAQLHPARRIDSLRPVQQARLHAAILEVLGTAIENRGTSIDDYLGGLGEQGSNQNFLHVYGRTGQPCERCGTTIRKMMFGQRGTHYCPRCQPKPRSRRVSPLPRP